MSMDYSYVDALFGLSDHASNDENLDLFSSNYSTLFDPNEFERLPDPTTCTTNYNKEAIDFNSYGSSHYSPTFTAPADGMSFRQSVQQLSSPGTASEVGPFSIQSRIPVPGLMPLSRYHLWLETSFMCRRNERERQRVRNVNDGFSRLRNQLPRSQGMKRRQSKVETLQHAIKYIKHLQRLLEEDKPTGS